MQILSGYKHCSLKGPSLQVDILTTRPTIRTSIPIFGQYISINPLKEKYCLGGYDLINRRTICCPNQNIVFDKNFCNICIKFPHFNPAFYNVPQSQLSFQQQAYNLQPHCVYLAYFGKYIIKVGISNQKRLLARWLEQGARAAVVLQYMENAYIARYLENLVSSTYKVAERINGTQKQQYIHTVYDFDRAVIELAACRDRIIKDLNNIPAVYPIQNLQDYYFRKKQPAVLYQATEQDRHTIAGEIVGMIGDIIVYEQGGYYFIKAIKSLLGKAEIKLHIQRPMIVSSIQTKLDLFG